MVLTLAIPIRKFYRLEDFITLRHLENCAKIMLATGLMVAHGYITEGFMSWYSDDKFEIYMTLNRMFGPYAPAYWLLIFCNILVPQAVWFKTHPHQSRGALRHRAARECRHVDRALCHRRHQSASRFPAVVVGHLSRHALGLDDVDRLVRACSSRCFFLFLRLLPAISISEMRDLVHEKIGAADDERQSLRHHGGIRASRSNCSRAARAAYKAGYRKMDAYSPYAVEGVAEAIGFTKRASRWSC